MFMNPPNWLQGKRESEDFGAVSLCLLDELSMIQAVNFQPLILSAANISDSWKSLSVKDKCAPPNGFTNHCLGLDTGFLPAKPFLCLKYTHETKKEYL